MKKNNKIILIDGYNLMFLFEKQKQSASFVDFESIRNHFIQIVSNKFNHNTAELVIVFDGADISSSCETKDISNNKYKCKIIYTPESQTADTFIINYAEKLKRGNKHVTVVTSDKEIENAVKKYGVNTIPSENFLISLGLKKKNENLIHDTKKEESVKKPVISSEAEVDYWEQLFGLDKTEDI